MKYAAERLEYTYPEIEKLLNDVIGDKFKVFLFNKPSDFIQNRISPIGEGTEGFSELFKNRLVVPLLYSNYDFDHLIAHEFTHIMQFHILYGGFWRSPKLAKGLSGLLPLWIMEGQPEHISHKILNRPWSSYDRMILRDAVLNGELHNIRELHNFNALYPDTYLAYKESHSAIDYLVSVEGEDINYRLLKKLRNNLDPVKAFDEAVEEFSGMKDFSDRWHKDLKKRVKEFSKGLSTPEESCRLIINDEYNSINPVYAGGDNFYYVSNRWGINEIYFYNGKKSENVLKNYFGSNVKMLFTGRRQDRVIDFCPATGDIVFLAKNINDIFLGIYNRVSGRLQEIDLGEIKEARSASLSGDGSKVLFTGLKDGKRNIFIYDRGNSSFEEIKGAGGIDYSPIFYPSGDKILTVTERNYNTDFRVIDLRTLESSWLTETPENEIEPTFDNESGRIYYSADKNSVYNLFSLKPGEKEPTALSNINTGIFYPAKAAPGKVLASVYHKGSYKIGEFTAAGAERVLESEMVYLKDNPDITLRNDEVKKKVSKFSFSTDFFLPSFLYSTEIGFIGGGYWMISDMLGRHNLSLYGWAWPGMHNARIDYTLKKWRPDIYLTGYSEGEKYSKRDNDDVRYRVTENYYCVNTGFRYPLDIFNTINLWASALSDNIAITEDDRPEEASAHETETGLGIAFIRNTTVIEPFIPLKGHTLRILAYSVRPWEKFSRQYNTYTASAGRYTPLTKKLNLSSRVYYSRSEGNDKRRLKLDYKYSPGANYPYRLRGYRRGDFIGNNLASFSSELRYMLFPDIKWHIYFMWPDINFDSLSIKAFTDAGTCWNDGNDPDSADRWGKSWGLGLKLNIYLMQMAPAFLNVEFARPYNRDSWKTYIEFGSGYLKW